MTSPRGSSSSSSSYDVVRGTLDLLILKPLSLEAMHDWAVAQRLEQLSGDALREGQGSLYPALQRLEERGWVESEWRVTGENRRPDTTSSPPQAGGRWARNRSSGGST